MQTIPIGISDVEAWNDEFARTNDIDDYYRRSGVLIRLVERSRLACIRRLLAAEPSHRILEIGCGGGHVLQLFRDNALVGTDVSGEMIRKARRNLRGFRVELLKGELDELDLPTGGFDRIVCTEVLEHVIEPQRLLAEAARLLSPDGRMVVTLPNDLVIHRVKSAIFRSGLSRLPVFRRISWGGDKYHLHVWSADEMHDLLSRHFVVRRTVPVPNRLLPIRYCFECSSLPEVIQLARPAALRTA